MAKSPHRRLAEPGKAVRCAIYTRKSSEEGLEQGFNSLDAQREACAAYIASQKHEGWRLLPANYDDGGISGGTMERPALKRLLADIEAGQIDTVVVYKVDRLTRSLNDFARIVEVFDRLNVSFVSVTQQFNTTTSMGRLTLNMLLSFAQFEREVTGERIRDKIAASKQKGMWMGGPAPLGYDVRERKLLVNEAEAATVRHIFQRYAELGSVTALQTELDQAGIVSKVRVNRFGRRTGGQAFARGALYRLLQNRLYLGQTEHRGSVYPGQHDAIVGQNLWDQVQRQLADNRLERRNGTHAAQPSLLAGLIYDDSGQRMTPSHANKKGTRYRYYVSRTLIVGNRKQAPRARRVPADDLEGIVADQLRHFLSDKAQVFDAVQHDHGNPHLASQLVDRAAGIATSWAGMAPPTRRAIVTTLVARVDLHPEALTLSIVPDRLSLLHSDPGPSAVPTGQAVAPDGGIICITLPVRLRRAGIETRLLIDGTDAEARDAPDRSLHRLLGQAQRFQSMLLRGGKTMAELADEAGVAPSYFTRIVRLSFLAPDITTAILRDQHPVELTAKRLANEIKLPLDWDEQRRELGFR